MENMQEDWGPKLGPLHHSYGHQTKNEKREKALTQSQVNSVSLY